MEGTTIHNRIVIVHVQEINYTGSKGGNIIGRNHNIQGNCHTQELNIQELHRKNCNVEERIVM